MIKKSIASILCFVMISLNVFADGTEVSSSKTLVGETIIYTLTLEQAIDMALDNNPQLNACLVRKQNNKTQLAAARDTKAGYRDVKEIFVSAGYEVNYIRNGYYVHLYQDAVNLSDYEYKQIEAQITYNITQKYFTLKNYEKLLEIAKDSYDLVKKNYDTASLSYELGLIAKTDLESVKVSLLQAEYNLKSYTDTYEIAKEDFKIALRKNNENCDFVLTSNLNIVDFQTNLLEDLVKAENSRYDILSLKSNYERSKEYYELTNLPENTARFTSAFSNYITAEYNYTNNKALILLGIKSSYNNISSTYNNAILTEQNFKLKENAYEIAQIKYEQGLITNTELLTALNELYNAEVNFENAKLNYVLAVDKYKYDIQIGL